ncbi:MAG: FumA C-terminus/TtdB family hydratase beta subunit [Candidatus Methanomethylicaceae archaeon]
MRDYHLTTPLDEEQIRRLRVGDKVYLSGLVIGVRDATLIRLFDEGRPCPIDLRGQVVLHTAPNVRKEGDRYIPLSVGTTTSARMDRFTRGLLELGVRAIAGKGGLYLPDSLHAIRDKGAVYLTVVGGAAAWETSMLESIEGVYWEDLMPEALWVFRFRALGPLFVSIDSHGGNLYHEVLEHARVRLEGRSSDNV